VDREEISVKRTRAQQLAHELLTAMDWFATAWAGFEQLSDIPMSRGMRRQMNRWYKLVGKEALERWQNAKPRKP